MKTELKKKFRQCNFCDVIFYIETTFRNEKLVMRFPYWQNWPSLLVNGPLLTVKKA